MISSNALDNGTYAPELADTSCSIRNNARCSDTKRHDGLKDDDDDGEERERVQDSVVPEGDDAAGDLDEGIDERPQRRVGRGGGDDARPHTHGEEHLRIVDRDQVARVGALLPQQDGELTQVDEGVSVARVRVNAVQLADAVQLEAEQRQRGGVRVLHAAHEREVDAFERGVEERGT